MGAGTEIESRLLNTLTFVKASSFFPSTSPAVCPYETILVIPDVNVSHLRLFHQVCSQPQRLELASVLDSRRAQPFIEDLRCRKV